MMLKATTLRCAAATILAALIGTAGCSSSKQPDDLRIAQADYNAALDDLRTCRQKLRELHDRSVDRRVTASVSTAT